MSPVKLYESCEKLERDTKIWRFMNIDKFIYLLQEKNLYFCQAKIVAEKYDAHEGRYPKEFVREILKKSKEKVILSEKRDSDIKYPTPSGEGFDFFKQAEILDFTYINCWHINDVEYDFMWRLYAERGLGIAIQTTFGKLCDCLNLCNIDINIAPVDYVPELEYFHQWEPILVKREHFKPEQELRIWVCGCEEPGVPIEVDLDILIDNIYLKPKTTEDQRKIIQKLVYDYNLYKNVLPSTIDIKLEDYENM